MSHTRFPDPDPASVEDALRLRSALIESGLASSDGFAGCTDEEIAAIQSVSPIPLPSDYVAFLQLMGHRADGLFQGRGVFYPEPLDTYVDVRDLVEKDGENISMDGRFFFGHHQGYVFFFFEKEDPAVYSYTERHADDLRRLSDSFLAWGWAHYEQALEVRARGRLMFEERQQKREAMGLPREDRGTDQ
ncbi:SMI1/KNR4 family protein [Nocardia tengchongensis]|uniref:SMI1/KNR4 family protein n=1 Tax=Nocardia tengchongensis TaxID=2055889 RepID=UPI0036AFB916